MTLDAMHAYIWGRLSTVPRTLAGRRIVSRIVIRAVRGWPLPVLEQCDAGQAAVVGEHYTRALKRQARQEFGMGILLSLVLGAIVQEVVKLLVQWWLASRENRDAMRALTIEARHHD